MTTKQRTWTVAGAVLGLLIGLFISPPADSDAFLVGVLPAVIFAVSWAAVGYYAARDWGRGRG